MVERPKFMERWRRAASVMRANCYQLKIIDGGTSIWPRLGSCMRLSSLKKANPNREALPLKGPIDFLIDILDYAR